MQRLDRRTTILRGKRATAYDPNQTYLAAATRERAARKIRCALRSLDPVILHTPRWSRAPEVLDDILVDLAIGEPSIHCKLLALSPMQGQSANDCWSYLVRAVMEFCDLTYEGPAGQAVNRRGFRSVMGNLLRRTIHGERCALLIHGVETMDVEALEDFVRVFGFHMTEAGESRKLTIVLAGSVSMANVDLPGAVHLSLPDFGQEEAFEHFVEYIGHTPPGPVNRAIDLVGGVPALLNCIGEKAQADGFGSSKEDHIKALGPVMEELRHALAIVSADQRLAERLEDVARHEVLPMDESTDQTLLGAGLLRQCVGREARVALRAQVFLHLLNG
jgi:hypothetical protein